MVTKLHVCLQMKTEYTSLEKGVDSKIWNFGSNNADQSSTNFDLEMLISGTLNFVLCVHLH